jgi:DNA-binding Lrp family transcriptional regulator
MKKLKDVDYKILFELIKNSKISDRKLAQALGVSQPTVTRRRAMLEREKLLDYTALPNLEKLGVEILALTYARCGYQGRPEEKETDAKMFLSKHPNVIFAFTGRGLGMNMMLVSLHKNYAEYAEFTKKLRAGWGKPLINVDTFMVSLKGDSILRQFTFKFLADYLRKGD